MEIKRDMVNNPPHYNKAGMQDPIYTEFNEMMAALDKIGVKVFKNRYLTIKAIFCL